MRQTFAFNRMTRNIPGWDKNVRSPSPTAIQNLSGSPQQSIDSNGTKLQSVKQLSMILETKCQKEKSGNNTRIFLGVPTLPMSQTLSSNDSNILAKKLALIWEHRPRNSGSSSNDHKDPKPIQTIAKSTTTKPPSQQSVTSKEQREIEKAIVEANAIKETQIVEDSMLALAVADSSQDDDNDNREKKAKMESPQINVSATKDDKRKSSVPAVVKNSSPSASTNSVITPRLNNGQKNVGDKIVSDLISLPNVFKYSSSIVFEPRHWFSLATYLLSRGEKLKIRHEENHNAVSIEIIGIETKIVEENKLYINGNYMFNIGPKIVGISKKISNDSAGIVVGPSVFTFRGRKNGMISLFYMSDENQWFYLSPYDL